MHAGRAAQRLDADAGIVGQRRQAAFAADVARLGQRVLDEGAVRLFGLGDAELRLRQHLDAERREHALELAQLAGIVGCDDQFFHCLS